LYLSQDATALDPARVASGRPNLTRHGSEAHHALVIALAKSLGTSLDGRDPIPFAPSGAPDRMVRQLQL
jgi:hypothetical protein